MRGLELFTVFPINTETFNYLSVERSAAVVMRVSVSVRTKVETFTHPSVIENNSNIFVFFDYWINEAED